MISDSLFLTFNIVLSFSNHNINEKVHLWKYFTATLFFYFTFISSSLHLSQLVDKTILPVYPVTGQE